MQVVWVSAKEFINKEMIFSESHQKNLRKSGRMLKMNLRKRAVICRCRNILRNCFYRSFAFLAVPKKNIPNFFSYCVPEKMQVTWVTSKGFLKKQKIVVRKSVRKTWERMEEWNRWFGRNVPWFVAVDIARNCLIVKLVNSTDDGEYPKSFCLSKIIVFVFTFI